MSLRVLVTRAAGGASLLAAALAEKGMEPVVVPTIEIAAPASFAALDWASEQLQVADWLLFTSANGVAAFAARRREIAITEPLPEKLRVAVIGEATARAARSHGFPVHLLPPRAVAESFAEALAPFARQPDGRPAYMLLLRAEEGREVLPETLQALGAVVDVVPAYRTVIPGEAVEQLRRLFAPGDLVPAAISFTSASTVRNLLALCDAAGVSLPESALRVSIGPVTSDCLRGVGLPPDAEAPEATVMSLAETVRRVLQEGLRGPDSARVP